MSSDKGGGISGGVARGGGGSTHRKNPKKFGKNLNKLTKAPAAPPVPVISVGSGGSSSFRGSSSSRNGLLLLSTKSKSSSGGGLLASSGTPKTAHDALLLSAGAGGQEGGEAGKKLVAPAWGMGEKKQKEPSSSLEKKGDLKRSGERKEKPELVLERDRRNTPAQQQIPLSSRSAVIEMGGSVNDMDLNKVDSPKKIALDSGASNDETVIDKAGGDVTQPKESVTQPIKKLDLVAKQPLPKQKKVEKVKDDQVEYMSKLAKERAEKVRLEEEARMAAQKERAAIRLRELEEKRLEEKKKLQQIKSLARKELSRPSNQVILEPLGKSKKDALDPFSPKQTSKTPEKKGGRTLYDPDRPFSSLVGGKTTKHITSIVKKEERLRGNTRKSPVHGPSAPVPYGKQSMGQSYSDTKKDDPPPPVHMVQLSKLGELDRGGRGEGQGGPRMLFDPSSGSMVAVPSREEPKSMKKTKIKGPQKTLTKRSDEVSKIITRRPIDGTVANESSSDAKLLRGKQGKGSRKDEPLSLQQRNKKNLDNKGRQSPRKRVPRTCGVLYKMDKSGNFLNADGCEPDNGYGAYHVPGGKVKNPGAHAKFLQQEEEQKVTSDPTSATATATEGFSYRNDPGFLEHQTNFEAQQQKILEDAWASLVENDDPEEAESNEKKVEEELPASKSGDEDYTTALAISSSMIGLNFDTNNDNIDPVMLPPAIKVTANPSKEEPIDLAKFAMQAASSASPANPFSPLGVSGAGLWGAGTSSATSTSYGDLGALTGWDATPFAGTDTAAAAGSSGLNDSSSQASKLLHLWGASALDGSGIGVFGNKSDTPNGAN